MTESTYSKDYWDQVFEQLSKRRVFKAALATLALLYAAAIYAPLIANDRPYVLAAANYEEYGAAHRTLYPVTLGLTRLVAMDEAAYVAQRTQGSTQSLAEALRSECSGALDRVRTLSTYLPGGTDERLSAYAAGVASARDLALAGDRTGAAAAMEEMKELAKVVRSELAPADPNSPEKPGVKLAGARSYPLFEALGFGEIFFMTLWAFVLSWPLWNRLVNRVLLGGDRVRIRGRRRTKWAVVLATSALAALVWKLTVDGSTTIAAAPFKGALTSGQIVPERALFPPLAFGFAETNSGEYFRPPTWKPYAEIDEAGYYAHGARMPEPDPITGVLPSPAPVQVRYAEPGRNAWHRHLLGTDRLGRDLLVRALYGARISLSVGLISAFLLVVIGTTVGALAGFFGGGLDLLLSRCIELLLCFPPLFLILMVLSFTNPAVVPPILAIVGVIGCFYWTGVARLARGEFLKLREQEFVVAARALGLSPARTIFRHILPNAMGPILVSGAFAVATGILTESSLSFLGFGVSEPVPSWGALVNDSRNPEHWWVILFPGLLIFVTVSCYNLVGDAVRDAVDPRLKD
jgi:peptide/nickel transport system permease protein